ncbi:hypothetical protein QYM36_001851 [Artemia franciscana]|uniref:Uncharacterized protein n=1 Tax=Artemia franciscana TaxID=6661 RepID=A0AA88LEA8_ARTSF|nr:hypothetical protein QYM36_001851 [Artemia franciscana]
MYSFSEKFLLMNIVNKVTDRRTVKQIKINAVPTRAVAIMVEIMVGSWGSKTNWITEAKLTPNEKLQTKRNDSLIQDICFVEPKHATPKNEMRANKAPTSGVTISVNNWMHVPRIHATVDM